MDERVNDFLNEINEIAPLDDNKDDCVWEKCFDKDSGYYYYWNVKTNEVTWDMPSEYKSTNKTKTRKSNNLYIPPRSAPLFPSTSNLLPRGSDSVKIYKIGECSEVVASTSLKPTKDIKKEVITTPKEEKKKVRSKPFRKRSDSDDEKIVLISSYGGDSESEEESSPTENKLVNGSKPLSSTSNSDEDEILRDLSKSPKTVEVVTSVTAKMIPDTTKTSLVKPEISSSTKVETKQKHSGFSLVVGYSDSEEETESEPTQATSSTIVTAPLQENKISHSTLFPITKPINVKDFELPPKVDSTEEGGDSFDSKVFQRKRRIGVALVNTGKKLKVDETEGERKGFGFSVDSSINTEGERSMYSGFKSGGIMFVKADVLNPPPSSESPEEKPEKSNKDIEDTYRTLKEKLGFLSEARDAVSPVQVMLIQLETLYTALKAGDLRQSYLRKWLDETSADLIKLEKETTPEGWLLQWDRSHKRYYYQNATTGESQWEYPQADVTVCDEAMDICTTPPPNGSESIHMSPPLPPIIKSPTPPPPPNISESKPQKKKKCDIPLPPEPQQVSLSEEKYDSNGEPLPPGVDLPDVAHKSKDNDLIDALSSFYSDIAAIETSNSPPIPNTNEDAKTEQVVESSSEPTKKKKKNKVKLAQGIAMKKKGVSKLVEKWKNVQLSYND